MSYIANLLQYLICADRIGDWEKHRTVEKLFPIFQQRDSINLKYGNFYLKKIKRTSR